MATASSANILRLVEKAYGVIDRDKATWDDFAADLAASLGDCHVYLIDFSIHAKAAVLGVSGNKSNEIVGQITSAEALVENIMEASKRNAQKQGTFVPSAIVPDDIAVHFGGPTEMRFCKLDDDGDRCAVLMVLRPDDAGSWKQDEIELIEMLSIHLGRSIRMARQLRAERDRTGAALNVIDRLDIAAALLDASGRVIFTNKALQRVLAHHDGLELSQDRLQPTAAKARQLIEKHVRDVACSDTVYRPCYVSLPRPSGGRPLQLSIGPIGNQETTASSPQDGQLLVLVNDPDAEPEISADALQQLFGVTGREAQVIAQLTSGQYLGEAAKNLGITRDTVTVHIEHALAKTGARRQAELVALALRSPARQLKVN